MPAALELINIILIFGQKYSEVSTQYNWYSPGEIPSRNPWHFRRKEKTGEKKKKKDPAPGFRIRNTNCIWYLGTGEKLPLRGGADEK